VLRLGVSRVAVHRLTFGLVPNSSLADDIGMAYIIERNDRYYVVAYDGNDPRTGKERRRWHPAGTSREDAEAIAARLSAERQGAARPNDVGVEGRAVPARGVAPTPKA
jgi:hypothetical protein